VDFLDRLNERDRERLVAVSTAVRLARGEYLIRRGERGGDFYRVVEGELEVIDGRQQPAVVLDVLGRGAMVGEMGFMEEQVRTADVRAGETSVCQRWERGALVKVLDADPPLAAAFYRALAGLAVDRSRSITTSAMLGALAGGSGAGAESAVQQARTLASRTTAWLVEVEPLIRRDRPAADQKLVTGLHNFMGEFENAVGRLGHEEQLASGAEVARELHPYLMRSHLGEIAIDRVEGWAGDCWTLAHIAARKPVGDGPLGEMLDSWLLELPTSRALRERRALAAQLVSESIPSRAPVRVLAVGANSALPLASEFANLGRVPGEMVCIEGSRAALGLVEAAFATRPRSLKVKLVQDDLAAVCAGRGRAELAPQDVVVIDGILEYLPERETVKLVRTVLTKLAPGGKLIVTALCPAPDDAVYRHLLNWPLIRRTHATLRGLLAAAGASEVRAYEAGSAGVVLVGARPLV
jgi:extracellular factor (EF) 3-hydroxypalmitic acid methyl ester biosynthesis protein